ncbi:hypothetical protein LCGC14_0427320 [marine sediment metagenome]|uniref:Uncharacterized protein n=1 Tax=marine sediment metagenome TaxID=412755 RepID=A0A0F9SP96_9ZZZZ
MTRRIDELARIGAETNSDGSGNPLLKTAADFKATLEHPKYEELLQRAQAITNIEPFTERAGGFAKDRQHSETDWDGMQKEAAGRKKTQMSRKKIVKDINDNRVRYRDYRNNLAQLESERDKLECMIQSSRDGVHNTRKRMLHMGDVLQKLDLADSNYAILYDNDSQDVSYLMNKEEYNVQIGEDGELVTTPWRDYTSARWRDARDARRQEQADIDDVNDDNDDIADLELIPGIERLEDSAPRTEDQTITSYPNLRFAE